jgi:AraC family transcriptional regulator
VQIVAGRIAFFVAPMKSPRQPPPVDLESYVPRAIAVVRRSRGWPGFFLHERRGDTGTASYPNGIRQHVLYFFPRPARQEIVQDGRVKPIRYDAGEARFTPAGTPVMFRWVGPIRVFILAFEPWYLERIAAELGTTLHFSPEENQRKLPANHPVTELVRQLAAEIDAGAGAEFLADSLARAIAVHLLRRLLKISAPKPPPVAPPAAVLRAVALMRSRLADGISLDELARAAQLSPFHFARQFKAATGHPPHDYHIRLRVDRAQELLRTRGREWTLAAIASECGFVDQSHFSRHFKRVVGVTPGEYLG